MKRKAIILSALIIVSIIFMIFSTATDKQLKIYNTSDTLATTEQMGEEKTIETYIYEDTVHYYSIEIPEGWEKIEQNNSIIFVHKPSSSSIQIQVKPYEPAINQMNAETASFSVVDKGYTFLEYTRISTSSFEVIYKDMGTISYNYIQTTHWNNEYIYVLTCICSENNTENIIPYFDLMLNSFSLGDDNMIPSDMVIYYSAIGDFEFGYPSSFMISQSESAICAVSPNSDVQINIFVKDFSDNLEKFSATDMTNMISQGKAGFRLNEFQSSINNASSTSEYLDANGATIINKSYLFSTGFYLYVFQFEFYQDCLDDETISACLGYYREFYTQKQIDAMD